MEREKAARAVYEKMLARTKLQEVEAGLEERLVRVGHAVLEALDRYMDAVQKGEDTTKLGAEFLRLWTVFVLLKSGDDIRALGSALKEIRAALTSSAPASKKPNASQDESPVVSISI